MVEPTLALTGLAALVSMGSAVGVFAYVRWLVRSVEQHERVLHGEPSVDGWDGIVPEVRENSQQLEELWDA